MYLLEVDRGGELLVHGLVRAEWPLASAASDIRTGVWARLFLRSAALWSQLKPLSLAVRVAAEPAQGVTTIHSIVVPKAQEERLRLVLAAFLRTDQLAGGSTAVPQHGEELAGRFFHPGEARIVIERERLQTGDGLRIGHNIRLADHLPRLMRDCLELGLAFAYEAQAAPWTPPRDTLKEVLVNAGRLEETSGVPPALARDQRAAAERLRHATFNVEECLAAPGAGTRDALAETLSNVLAATIYTSFRVEPKLAAPGDAADDAFALHVHSHVLDEAPASLAFEEISCAATADDVDAIACCRGLGLEHEAGPAGPGGDPLSARLADPRPAGGGGAAGGAGDVIFARSAAERPFLFVSYARADSDRVYPMVEALEQRGVSVWMDRSLTTGNDWVSELEARLIRCRGVMAFISTSFVASKHCGRELRVADALNRSIIPVVLQEAELFGSGLGFILSSIQRVDAARDSSLSSLLGAIGTLAPETLSRSP
jgi:hypothetical protein